jgi:hypothetical protein
MEAASEKRRGGRSWPPPHPMPRNWPRQKMWVVVKVSAPKGLTKAEVRRELKTMVNHLRYSDGFPGEVRVMAVRHAPETSRLMLRYQLQPIAPPKPREEWRAEAAFRSKLHKRRLVERARAEKERLKIENQVFRKRVRKATPW